MHRRLAGLAVALCLVTAGCASFAPGGSTPTVATESPTATPTATPTETPTATPTPTPTPTAEPTLDAAAVARRHADALGEAGSFERYLVINGSVMGATEESAVVDVDRGRVLAERSSDPEEANSTHYRDPEGLYSRLVDGEDVAYRYRADANDTSIRPERYVDAAQVYDFVNATDWRRVGVETYRGAEVVRYEARGPYAVSGFDNETGQFADADVVRAVLLVGTDDVVRLMHVTYHEDDYSAYFETTYRYGAVGETTVPVPEWRDAARNASDG